jgi:hypothetical protein
MDDWYAGSMGTWFSSEDLVGNMMKWSMKICETNKTQHQEGDAGIITLVPSLRIQHATVQ